MKFIKIIFLILAVVLVFGLGFFAYLGAFSSVHTSRHEVGPMEGIAKMHKGPYNNIGKTWEAFEKEWNAAGLKECDGFAVYLDPPSIPPENLRSVLACNISTLPETQKRELRKKFPSFALPKYDSVVATFPFKNVFSFMVGPMRVYPKLQRALERENGKPSVAVEIYGPVKSIKEMTFVMPIAADRDAIIKALWKE
jgi:hypothetical protein